jgi:hypothetical protein
MGADLQVYVSSSYVALLRSWTTDVSLARQGIVRSLRRFQIANIFLECPQFHIVANKKVSSSKQ